jgi:hypothetical protein
MIRDINAGEYARQYSGPYLSEIITYDEHMVLPQIVHAASDDPEYSKIALFINNNEVARRLLSLKYHD